MSHNAAPPPAVDSPIAVIGIGALFPGAPDAGGFWRNICAGRDLVTEVPPTHWLAEDYLDPDPSAPDKTYCARGAFLTPVPFSPVEFGIPPAALTATDTSQLLALIVAQQALADASGGREGRIPRERTCVILGATSGQELLVQAASRLQRPVWLKALREAGIVEDRAQAICDAIAGSYVPWQENTFPGLLGNVIAGRIANRFDLGGTNCVTDAACASSFSALAMAIDELRLGRADLALAGGVDTFNDIAMYVCFSKTPALSATGDCRPFSADADGTVLGEGLALFALKRLADAEADGDAIYAVLRGVGTSSDGRAKSIYAPLPEGQARALSRAYGAAGYGPETVELVEAHGTATRAGDAAEVAGLKAVFGQAGGERRHWCALGSVKSQVGHTKAAAGAAGLFKAVMALHHKVLPPTIKVAAPNPALALDDSPFYLNVRARPWVRAADHPRRASVSSFGFGGSNFHVAVEEYTGAAPRPARVRAAANELVVLARPDGAALAQAARALAAEAVGDVDFSRLAVASRASFDPALPVRLAVVVCDKAEAFARLGQAADRLDGGATRFELPGVYCGAGPAVGSVAFLFPGQGSQRIDMGADLAIAFDAAREVWDRAADAMPGDGPRLHEVVFPVPAFRDAARAEQAARLTRTEWAQPSIGAASLATLAVLRAAGVSASCVGGHSFGELTALAAAGALDESALLTLARRRGEAMAAAARAPGMMTAVMHDVAAVEAKLAGWALDVTLANRNSPRQCVLSGSPAAIEEAERRLAAEGIRTQRLAVATAFHSPIVAEATTAFRQALDQAAIAPPALPAFSNVDGAPHPRDGDAIRARLADQIAAPVRFDAMVRAMHAAGARFFVEVGPGAALTRFVEDCLGDDAVAVATDRKGDDGVAALWHALGRLAAAGVAMRLSGLDPNAALPAPVVGAKPAFTVPIGGANYGKIYPPAGGAAALPPPVRAEPAPMMAAPPSPALASVMSPPTPLAAPMPGPSLSPGAAPSRDTGAAFGMFQRALSDAQTAYQTAVADSHGQYLRTMEAAFTAWAGGRPVAATGSGASLPALPVFDTAPAVMAPPAWTPAPPIVAPPAVMAPAVMAPVAPPIAPPIAPLVAVVAAPAAAPAVADVLLAVVAEKTGYPPEMLKLDMALEADLGIDSIKRVEILAALQDRLPGLPDIAAGDLGTFTTLGDIVTFARSHAGSPQHPMPAAATAAPAVDVARVLIEVVADKTGYPPEMLKLDMALEADLGIDSIKRVEIFATLQDRLPGMPEVQANELGALGTLGHIVRHIETHFGGGGAGAHVATDAGDVPLPANTNDDVDRRVVIAVPATDDDWSMLATVAGPVVLIGGGDVAPALMRRLESRGLAVRCVALSAPAELDGAAAVVFLGGLDPVAGADQAMAINRAAFAAAQQVAARFARTGGTFVIVQDTGGDFGLGGRDPVRAWLGGLAGLAKTAALEWPAASVKAIDVETVGRTAEAVADALVAELTAGARQCEVGLTNDGRRLVLDERIAPVGRSAALDWPSGGVLVATGGGRGLTAATLTALAGRLRPRVALLGRTPAAPEPAGLADSEDEAALVRALARLNGAVTPAALAEEARRILAVRAVAQTLAGLRAAGVEARYCAVDVRDGAAMAATIAVIRDDWGPIAGVIHGAGVLHDRTIADKTAEQFEHVFATKADGLRNLLDATRGDPLRLIGLFSSVAGRSGNVGQSDYAMANEVLNKVAQAEARRRGGACLVKSINWGPVEGGMVTPALVAHFRRQGVPLLSLAASARAFADEIEHGAPDEIEVILGGSLASAPSQLRSVAE